MDVKVINALATVNATIDHQAVALFEIQVCGDCASHVNKMSE
jgi:hypothetical protein